MATGHDEVATAIITGQQKLMGAVAITLAQKVSGVQVDGSGSASIEGDGDTAVDGLVKAYSSLTGALGVRMCFASAQGELQRHPDVRVSSFTGLG